VNTEFSTNRLSEASLNLSKASRFFGVPIGRKYIQRIAVLRAVDKFNQLFGFQALRLHPLKGNRSNQYSITLTGNYRLIIEKIEEDRVRIMDVEDYHGD
jgi:plasmid maintenance system killer protein